MPGRIRSRPCSAVTSGMPLTLRLELVGRLDRLGDQDVRRLGHVAADLADELLEVRPGEEVVKSLLGHPLVADQDVAVADAETVMDRAGRLRLLGDRPVLIGPLSEGLGEDL